jgi:toxin ParE1/3/4
MRFRIEFSAEAERNFALIFDHLFESYRGFGESVEAALDHCEDRIREIRQEADRLRTAPYRGDHRDDLLPGLRHLTIDQAVYWFDVNDAEQRVRFLAIFFGSEDHIRHMLTRLLTPWNTPFAARRWVRRRSFKNIIKAA